MSEAIVEVVFGKRGCGKSFLTREYILPKHKRIIVYDVQEEYNTGIIIYTMDDLKKFLLSSYKNDTFSIVFRQLTNDNFSDLCEIVYLLGNCLFIVEELDQVASTYYNDMNFQTVLKRGRHQNVSFVGVSQRPFGIHRTITSQAKRIYSFSQTEPRDVQYLTSYLGDEAELVTMLRPYHFIYFDYSSEDIDIMTLEKNNLVSVKNKYLQK